MSKTEATIKLDDTQIYFLRRYFDRRKDISADRLIKMAVLEIVAKQAQKELAESEITMKAADWAAERN